MNLLGDLDPAAIFEELLHRLAGPIHGATVFMIFFTSMRTGLKCWGLRGTVQVELGGAKGKRLRLRAGDVAVLPAGTGHQRIGASGRLLVVGAYPRSSSAYDEPKPSEVDHQMAVEAVASVPRPKSDLVYGRKGPLLVHWR